jgi:Zn-dependent protease/CBS domain-containing protein
MRSWSLKLGTVAGIDIFVHATFFLIVAWVALSQWALDGTLAGVAGGVAFILALFGCVLLHELGHALAARRYGVGTRDVTLWPIGGVATLERMPEEPRQELWIALAGPAVSLAIAVALFLYLFVVGQAAMISGVLLTGGSLVERLMIANVFLAVFNLLPAFPMDGGRAFRALLALRMDYARATSKAASVGQAMALLFGFVGIFVNPFLLLIALFVWIGAAQEASAVQARSALAGLPVRKAMITDFRTLHPRDTLRRGVEMIVAGTQQDFPVVEQGRVVGVLTRADLLLALAKEGQEGEVEQTMRREFQPVDPDEMLTMAAERLRACDCYTMPVIRGGELVGLLTMDNLGEFMMIQAALRKGDQRRPGGEGRTDDSLAGWGGRRSA